MSHRTLIPTTSSAESLIPYYTKIIIASAQLVGSSFLSFSLNLTQTLRWFGCGTDGAVNVSVDVGLPLIYDNR